MPAVIPRNLHSGFLNEEYGVLLLRQIAAVATVGRAEDHGVDAVATLLPRANELLHAADTFLIQFKSESVRAIDYGGEDEEIKGEVHWLRSLRVPLFFGSVSRIEGGNDLGKLKIYGSQFLMAPLLLHPGFTKISVCFEEADRFPSAADEARLMDELSAFASELWPDDPTWAITWAEHRYHAALEALDRTVWWLDVPIVEFGLVEINDREFRERIISVLQAWVRIANDNLRLASVGMFKHCTWSTNEVPVLQHQQLSPKEPSKQESKVIYRETVEPLTALLLERLFHGKAEDINHIEGIVKGLARDGERMGLDSRFIAANWRQLAARRRAYRQSRGLEP